MRSATTMAIMVAGLACRMAAAGDVRHATYPLTIGAHGEPIVSVRLNGHGPYAFILDTGSTHTSVSDAVLAALDAPAIARTSVATSAGRTETLVHDVGAFALGPLTVSHLAVSSIPASLLDPARSVTGVVGQDVLADHRFTIDFEQQWIAWDDDALDGWPGSRFLGLEPEAQRFVVRLANARATLRLVADSGAETLVLYGTQPRNAAPGASVDAAVLETAAGPVTGRTTRVPLDLGFGAREDIGAVVVARPGHAHDIDGLLPLHLFTRLTFDAPGRQLVVGRPSP